MDKVTCAACGLLTIRNSETWELCEVDDLYRKEGKLHGSIGGKRIATPICFAGQFQLQEDHQRWKKAKGVSDDDCLVYTFTDERDCPSFQKWILGLRGCADSISEIPILVYQAFYLRGGLNAWMRLWFERVSVRFVVAAKMLAWSRSIGGSIYC